MKNLILGISAYYHDSAAVLLSDGVIVAAAQEERFTRVKHDPGFPSNAVRYVLEEAGAALGDVGSVVFYDKPYVKFERLLETYHAFAPRGLRSFTSAVPVWIKEKLFTKKLLRDELKKIGTLKAPLLFPEHHLSHAASAFFPSPFESAAILTIDGVGEWATTTIGKGDGNRIMMLRELQFPHSLGLLYSAFTYYLGFRVNSGEYKLMGLAPYGNPDSEQTAQYRNAILEQLVDLREDGSLLLNMDCFDFATGLTMCDNRAWEKVFDLPRRTESDSLTQAHMNLALAIQQVTEQSVVAMARTAKALTGCTNLCLAGGVALNCVANGKLLREQNLFEHLWIQPAAGDAGGALGAALAAWHIGQDKPRTVDPKKDAMQGAYLGPQFCDNDCEQTIRRFDAVATHYENIDTLCATVADLLDQGNVVGWVQGRMEYGPRALGNRTILGDARNPEMQKKLNLKIKYREGFRPFAPSVMEEHIGEYFDIACSSPYMLLVAPVRESRCNPLPEDYADRAMWDRLYLQRSDIPAVTHVDFSARIQSVNQSTNERYWKLINAFREKTGYGVVVNTSFNIRGEPIVCTPNDAYRCFMFTEMDYLVVGNFLFEKSAQPELDGAQQYKTSFKLD